MPKLNYMLGSVTTSQVSRGSGDTATECGSVVVAVWCYSHLEHMFVTVIR
jgi:hypothetical protein